MGNRLEKRKKKIRMLPKMKCSKCGSDKAHFVPPSFREPGFFICVVDPKFYGEK